MDTNTRVKEEINSGISTCPNMHFKSNDAGVLPSRATRATHSPEQWKRGFIEQRRAISMKYRPDFKGSTKKCMTLLSVFLILITC